MKFIPRIHLATAILVTLAAGALLGLNLRERRVPVVSNAGLAISRSPNRSELYSSLTKNICAKAGWPVDAYEYIEIYLMSSAYDATPLLQFEHDELGRLDLSQDEWPAQKFETLAPEIYRSLSNPVEKLYETKHGFIDFSGTWNRSALAINIATALGILIAVACVSEIFIRRQKTRH